MSAFCSSSQAMTLVLPPTRRSAMPSAGCRHAGWSTLALADELLQRSEITEFGSVKQVGRSAFPGFG